MWVGESRTEQVFLPGRDNGPLALSTCRAGLTSGVEDPPRNSALNPEP